MISQGTSAYRAGRTRRKLAVLAGIPIGVTLLATLTVPGAGAAPVIAASDGTKGSEFALEITTVLDDLDRPWDIAFTPNGTMLVTERDREQVDALLPSGERRILADSPDGVWHRFETGMMGIAVSPDFATNREFYVCHGWNVGETKDVRVTAWHINAAFTEATITRVVMSGIEIYGGKHAGCRLRFAPDGALFVSTGDARSGPLPQDKTSLNGKILRIDAATGEGWPGNPWEDAANANKRRVYTYGHRNAQGLAWRDLGGGEGEMWSVEQGTDRDDEVNQLRPGGNYGWNPMPDYSAFAPMTDHSLPGRQIDARWSSGFPTIATSGAGWITDDMWGRWQGRLAVGTTFAMELKIMKFKPNGHLVSVLTPPQLDGPYGDLRVPVQGPDGALYLATDNGEEEVPGIDRILRVVPAS
jgi:glucose/arabinose dehydrogenase